MPAYFTLRPAWLLGVVLTLLLGFGPTAHAQTLPLGAVGNEWLTPGQAYYKVRVGQRGIHRLSYQWLRAAGLPVATLDPRQFQLWRRGQEVPLLVAGETDAVLDTLDYVEFYGQPNDALLDQEMYKNPAEQTHQLAPLYTDTAAYFLTLAPAGTIARRMQAADQASTGLTPVRHHLQTVTAVSSGFYYRGSDYSNVYLPWLDHAEGLYSNYIGTVAAPKVDPAVNGPVVVDTLHGQPFFELKVAGCGFQIPVFDVSVLSANGMTVIRPLKTGVRLPVLFGDTLIQVPLRWRDISAAGSFRYRLQVTNVAPGTVPLLMVGYSRVRYVARNTLTGNPKLLLQTDSALAAGPQYMLFDAPPAAPRAFDVTDPANVLRYEGAPSGTQWGFVFNAAGPGNAPRRLLIQGNTAPIVPLAGQKVVFRNLQPGANRYLIVTHGKLMVDTLTGRRPVREYAAYRASLAGGQYDTLVITSTQLYDQFHYGDMSPSAVRRFAGFMSSGFTQPGYLFLLGKGFQPIHILDQGTQVNNRAAFRKTLVPTFGYPASDVMFTADFRGNQFKPRLMTGRLTALTPADVVAYLEKVREHEAAPYAPWRKNLLHLGGGKTPDEQATFRGWLANYERLAEDTTYLGGSVSTVLRGNSGQNVDTVVVSNQVNRGLTLLTFFGHSSTTVSDLEIGLASNPINNYNNRGRYPLLLMNGCASGNAFVNGTSFGQDWVNTPQRGAIGFLAHTGEGEPSMLNMFSSSFYQSSFNDSLTYGRSIARIHQRTIERVMQQQVVTGNPYLQAQLTEMVLQADPAVGLRTAERPDYFVADSTLSLRAFIGQRVTARADSFLLTARVRNLGKATRDPVRVQLKRRVNGVVVSTQDAVFAPIYNSDSVRLTVRNPPVATTVQGPNQFELFVDWPDSVREMSETNNQATLRLNLPSGSVFPLYPPEYALLPGQRTITLTGQYDQALAQPRPYQFELDTLASFRSPARQTALITAGRYPVWQPTLPAPAAGRPDSVVWYWRFRPQNLQPGEDTAWARSSFRFVPTTPGGWSQSHYGQFVSAGKKSVSQATPSGKWAFQPSLLRLDLRTTAGDSTYNITTFGLTSNGIRPNGDTYTRPDCDVAFPNIAFMVFEPRSLGAVDRLKFRDQALEARLHKVFQCGQEGIPGPNPFTPGQRFIYHANTLASATVARPKIPVLRRGNIDTLTMLLDSIPAGYYVALISMNRVPFDTLKVTHPALFQVLASFGAVRAPTLHDGDPYLLIGQKGGAPGSAWEASYDPAQPRRRQPVQLVKTLSSSVPEGKVVSTEAGPARRWRKVYHTVKAPNATASYKLTVVPLRADRTEGPRLTVTAASNQFFDLQAAGLDATVFPRLRLELDVQDSVNRQVPQLKQWLVTYDAVPEGIVRPDLLAAADLDLTPQTDSGYVRWKVPFQNISAETFPDSLLTEFNLVKNDGAFVAGPFRVKTDSLRAGAVRMIPVKLPVNRLVTGEYRLQGNVNPGPAQPELYLFNNSLDVPFRVVNPNLAPLVDVAFDGQHILHGDIVAPAPVISVMVRDEDRSQRIDPQLVKVFLTRPGMPVETVDLNGPLVQLQPSTDNRQLELTYRPGQLPNGTYRLQVQATDAAGNAAGFKPYDSEFQVINETMISNFYPYPNPFTTSTRFLFTVTGRVPENLKIQIMTVTGRVVREIMKAELGAELRVGHNASTLPWDGTDEYGDKLANGVYLYRVVVQDEASEFKTFRTAGDAKAFQKNWGKLYILR